ncbi:MAG: hypothetical protein ACYDHM_07685 [Acidiferrobacterales bacterium]
MTLKALASAVLARNSPRNSCATDPEKGAQLLPVSDTEKLREKLRNPNPATGPVHWQEWQAAHPPAPDAPPLTEAEEIQIRGWLHFIGETDPGEIADVVLTCWRYPGTRAWILAQHAAIPVRQAVARELAQESVEERAGILEHDGGLARQDAERIAQLAKAFYDHLFGPGVATGCCHGSTGKYCAEGKRLQTIYCKVTKAAHKLT